MRSFLDARSPRARFRLAIARVGGGVAVSGISILRGGGGGGGGGGVGVLGSGQELSGR